VGATHVQRRVLRVEAVRDDLADGEHFEPFQQLVVGLLVDVLEVRLMAVVKGVVKLSGSAAYTDVQGCDTMAGAADLSECAGVEGAQGGGERAHAVVGARERGVEAFAAHPEAPGHPVLLRHT
jgi:hypothetical protein